LTKNFWRNSAVFIICLLTSCILLEVIIRVFLPQKIEPNYRTPAFGIPNALRPNADIKIEKSKLLPDYLILTNEKSIRSNSSIPYQKDPQEFRILCLGDSVFFGPGIEFNDLFSTQLERLLNTNSKEKYFRVINAAVPSWGPLEYFTYLKNEGHKYSPDMIIISSFLDDLRQSFSKKMSFRDIEWKKTTDGFVKINLVGMKVSLSRNTFLNILWGKVSQSNWYAKLSKTSHLLNLIRFRMSAVASQGFQSSSSAGKSLVDFLKTSGLRLNPKIIWSYESKPLKINLDYQPALYFADRYKQDVVEAEANVVLYNVLMQKFLNLASKTAEKTLILKIPSFSEAVGLSRPKHPEWIFEQTDAIQHLDLFKPLFDFQNAHSPFLFFHLDSHWTPGGHLFFAKLLARYISDKKPFRQIHELPKQPIAWPPKTHQSVENANLRILEFLKKDHYQLLLNGMRQKNQNSLAEAEKTLTQYIQIQKEQYEAYFHLAMVHFKLNHYQKALTLLLEAQKGHPLETPKYRRAYEFIKIYWEGKKNLNQGQFKKALTFFIKADEIEKERELLNNELASIYNQLKDFSKAEFYYKREIKKRPGEVPSHLNLGSLYLANKLYNQAIEQYQKALKIDPNFFGTYALMGTAYFKLGEKDAALEMGQRALRLNPGDEFTKTQLKKWSKDSLIRKK
jgi:tetratricopeptide (TPR) repeat protein